MRGNTIVNEKKKSSLSSMSVKKEIKIHGLLFLGEMALAIIHLYYGISSLLNMLYDKFGLKLYYTMFWDYDKNTYKNQDYMVKAITYHMDPIYCILISMALSILLALIFKYNRDKNTLSRVLKCISVLVFGISLLITVGVMYCYFDEMSHEVV